MVSACQVILHKLEVVINQCLYLVQLEQFVLLVITALMDFVFEML
ncbi:unnamed protein product [Brugia pahangi]|uniref:Uncharacterized protein n=1 Tax=Brugia pahangi TaxID=6280 RepID=A0A0N4TFK4_BRUPA|nr:unnamed protein product [Brugia pahangi]